MRFSTSVRSWFPARRFSIIASGASTISDHKDNIHWFKCTSETGYIFNAHVIGYDPTIIPPWSGAEGFQLRGFKFEVLDCTRRRKLRVAFDGCDAIAHLAAKKIPRYGGTVSTLEINVQGVNAAAAVAMALDADLVFTSTSDVYGDGTPPYREDGQLVLEGDLSHVRRIGQGMGLGSVTIRGDVGSHLGAGMTGGPPPFAKADRSRFLQALDEACAQHVHGVLFQPAMAQQAQHQHHLRTVGLGEALLQGGDGVAQGEVLVGGAGRRLRP